MLRNEETALKIECLGIEMGAQFIWELRTHFLPSSPFYMRESTE